MQSSDLERRDLTYRSALLRRLREQLAMGRYHPAPELLAEGMLSRAFFDLLDRFPEDIEHRLE